MSRPDVSERALPANGGRPRSRPLWLLAFGTALGLAAALWGLLAPGGPQAGVPPDAVALLDGQPIARDRYEQALAALASDRRTPLDDADRRHVLDRLIDEELLIRRGLELGLARHDRRVRADLVGAVIESVVGEAEAEAATPEALRAFYDERRDWFRQPGRLRVESLFVRAAPGADAAPRERARLATERLRAGEPAEQVERELGDVAPAAPPAALLPPAKLREYLGPTALRAALALQPGEVSEPIRTGGGLRVLRLAEREPAHVPPFEEIEAEVEAEWRRRQGEAALRRYLDALRARADLRLALP